jgi:quercetin dioxygenase-like cupin family protein
MGERGPSTWQDEMSMRAGDVIWNPLTGEKALFVETADETDGARMVADFAVEQGGFVPGGEHVHDHCAEHIELQAGRVAFLIDGAMRAVKAGEQVTIAPGTWHRWWNASEDEVRARVRIEPAMRFQEAILVLWGLCADGHTDAEGRPSTLLGALLATAIATSSVSGSPPTPYRGSCFRDLPPSLDVEGLSARSIATWTWTRPPPHRRDSGTSPNG